MRGYENIKIGISGVRGIVGETLSPDTIVNFTRAFSTLIRKGKVAVARDSRPSGGFIERAVLSGLVYSGITPVSTGILPTPTLQIFVKDRRLQGGIIITASHNPKEWNGLKFVNSDGLFLSPFQASRLIDVYHQRSFIPPAGNSFPSMEKAEDAFEIHKQKIAQIIDIERIRRKRFRVLVDPGGGVGCLYDKGFLEFLGCEVEAVNHEIGPEFPRNPEPLPENITTASDRMSSGDFDIGFAQDSDGDRLAILDEHGTALDGNRTLAMALLGFLRNAGPGIVVFNLSTSRIAEAVAATQGFEVAWAPVGEINVVEKMIETGAAAGGEGNGGLIIPKIHYCRDSFTAMALALQTLAESGEKVSDIIDRLPKLKMVGRKITSSMTDANRIVSLLKEDYPEANTIDGLKVDKGDYWFHIRASNTESVLRITAEGTEREIEEIVDSLQKKIENMREEGV